MLSSGTGSNSVSWVRKVVFTDPAQSSLEGSWNRLKIFKLGTVEDIYVGQLAAFSNSSAQILRIEPYPPQKGFDVLVPALADLCHNGTGYVLSLGGPENPRLGVHTYFPNATFLHGPLTVATNTSDARVMHSGGCWTAPSWGWIERLTSHSNGVYRFRLAVTYKDAGHIYEGLLPHAMTWIIPYNVRYQSDARFCPGPRCGYLSP